MEQQVALPKGDWDILKLEDNDDGYQPFVAIRPGAIVPIGKIIQNTGEYKTDSLTLLINPQLDGSATGQLYDDAHDGFTYKKGEYVIFRFTASKSNKNEIKIALEKTEGNMNKEIMHWRVGYVVDNNITYSSWNSSKEANVKIKPDNQENIDLTKFKMEETYFRDNKSLNGLFKRRKIQIKKRENF